jgi:cell volume regulation protein A
MEGLVLIAFIFLVGTFLSGLSYALKVSNVFFLIFAGMILGIWNFIPISNELIITISEIALILIVFDASAKLRFNEVLKYSKKSFQLTFVFLFFSFIIIAPITYFFYGIDPIAAILFSILMYGIDPSIALSVLRNKSNRIVEILEIEAILNTPITLILSLFAFDIIKKQSDYISFSGNYIIQFLQQFVVAIGIGFIIGMAITKLLENEYFENLSHLIVITSAITTYVLSELIHGNGVLAVTVFGLIFGNHKIRHKLELERFESILTNTLNILVFVFLGIVLIKYTEYNSFRDFIVGIGLFVIYLIVRFISVLIIGKHIKFKEKLFMTFNVPKGIDVAIVIFFIIASSFSDKLSLVKSLSLSFVLYTIVLSTISSAFHEWFFS